MKAYQTIMNAAIDDWEFVKLSALVYSNEDRRALWSDLDPCK